MSKNPDQTDAPIQDSAKSDEEVTSESTVSTEPDAIDSPSDSEPTQTLTGYELVADMMRRQDAVIAELDSLNLKIEAVIEEITAARKAEELAAEHDSGTPDAAPPTSQPSESSPADEQDPARIAA